MDKLPQRIGYGRIYITRRNRKIVHQEYKGVLPMPIKNRMEVTVLHLKDLALLLHSDTELLLANPSEMPASLWIDGPTSESFPDQLTAGRDDTLYYLDRYFYGMNKDQFFVRYQTLERALQNGFNRNI